MPLSPKKITLSVAILAAGQGKRLKVPTPKPLLPLLGQTLIDYPLEAIGELTHSDKNILIENKGIGIVVGHKKEMLRDYLEKKYPGLALAYAVQVEQRGTADAIQAYFDQLPMANAAAYTLILCADVPLIEKNDLLRLVNEVASHPELDGVLATFSTAIPYGYGRIVKKGTGLTIVEEKDASPTEKQISEVNAGVYLLKTEFLKKKLLAIRPSPVTGELYLTHVFQNTDQVRALCFESETNFLGVNTLAQLEITAKHLQLRKNHQLQSEGVLIYDSASTFIDWTVKVEAESVISPQVHLQGKTTLGKGVMVHPGCILKDAKIAAHAEIKAYTVIHNSSVGAGAAVGPFAHLRPESHLADEVKIGNFVEIKKSFLHQGAKVSHLSYIGDAEIGEESNIGCGFVTCNYDGANKHKTTIGKNVFIGSDCQAVAPVTVGDDAFVAAGSTITHNVPEGGFAIARTRQVTKEGMAVKFMKKKKKG